MHQRRFWILLLALLLAAGSLLAWVVNSWTAQRHAVDAIREYGGFVHFDFQYVDGTLDLSQPSPTPGWLRRLVGEHMLSNVVDVNLVYEDRDGSRHLCRQDSSEILARVADLASVKSLYLHRGQATDEDLRHLRALPGLESLTIRASTRLTDAGLREIAAARSLRSLHIEGAPITDLGIAHLEGLTRLESMSLQGSALTDEGLRLIGALAQLKSLFLGLGDNHITDAGLEHLRSLTHLEVLGLQRTHITDAGLTHLESLSRLEILWIGNTETTQAGRDRLMERLPGLKVL